jgi:hypothetical protein
MNSPLPQAQLPDLGSWVCEGVRGGRKPDDGFNTVDAREAVQATEGCEEDSYVFEETGVSRSW